ncbi:phage virion morphogenesis protein [Rodentibacter genomosp. 1]|uniref:Phage virion morphogenesis protein n=1 Tax=Rodentibacter genomosp. 1 TaxID=1908264 RepID=A0A1V3J725_9PAST|nr:phage virion morphogenesis protein [Rodentibacter genomosp. 1]OOF50899.1 phage virion morphogenesis protein [Rodentibacter genomosp. 1]
MHLDYKFDTREIQNKFNRLAKVMDGRDITHKVAGVLRQEAEKAFDQEKTPEGESWEVLNEDYKKRRDAAGHTGKMLQITGDLVTSLNIDYGDSFAVIGASEPYGQYHQMGTEKMPARPFLGLGKDGIDEIKAILNRELSKLTQE